MKGLGYASDAAPFRRGLDTALTRADVGHLYGTAFPRVAIDVVSAEPETPLRIVEANTYIPVVAYALARDRSEDSCCPHVLIDLTHGEDPAAEPTLAADIVAKITRGEPLSLGQKALLAAVPDSAECVALTLAYVLNRCGTSKWKRILVPLFFLTSDGQGHANMLAMDPHDRSRISIFIYEPNGLEGKGYVNDSQRSVFLGHLSSRLVLLLRTDAWALLLERVDPAAAITVKTVGLGLQTELGEWVYGESISWLPGHRKVTQRTLRRSGYGVCSAIVLWIFHCLIAHVDQRRGESVENAITSLEAIKFNEIYRRGRDERHSEQLRFRRFLVRLADWTLGNYECVLRKRVAGAIDWKHTQLIQVRYGGIAVNLTPSSIGIACGEGREGFSPRYSSDHSIRIGPASSRTYDANNTAGDTTDDSTTEEPTTEEPTTEEPTTEEPTTEDFGGVMVDRSNSDGDGPDNTGEDTSDYASGRTTDDSDDDSIDSTDGMTENLRTPYSSNVEKHHTSH